MAARQLPARRYFAVLALIIVGMYALIFFTGSSRTPQLGLDLQGGTTVTLTARTPDGKAPDPADLELARQIIEQRVNGLGVAEAEVVTEGNSNIVISVPGDNGEKARELGATAQLRFRPVLQGPEPAAPAAATSSAAPTDGAAATSSAAPSVGAAATSSAAPTDSAAATTTAAPDPNAPPITQEQAAAEYATLTCDATTTSVDRSGDYIAACSADGSAKYLLGPAVLEGTDVTNAAAGTRPTTGEWIVTLDLNGSGSEQWATFTAGNVGKSVGITLDGRVVSAPRINGAINGGQTEISGSFTQATATDLANQLKYGALPLTFTQATAQSISTELGSEQLKAGLIAGAIGVALVFVYALIYYRLLGLVMIASLILSAVVVYASLVLLGRQIGFALSLAGIAGFIVSIGITADSFVVYFERLKDEVREGRSLRSATPRAWVRARRTILSADAVSFLAAAILYWLAIGDVKGFAFTLGLSTVLDLIVVFLFTHPLMAVLSRVKSFGSNRFSGLGRVDHSRRPAPPSRSDRDLVGAGSSTNGSKR
ncbi:MAG: secD [Modestobacter sp.]|nr:secD [Modestobacter sp.]